MKEILEDEYMTIDDTKISSVDKDELDEKQKTQEEIAQEILLIAEESGLHTSIIDIGAKFVYSDKNKDGSSVAGYHANIEGGLVIWIMLTFTSRSLTRIEIQTTLTKRKISTTQHTVLDSNFNWYIKELAQSLDNWKKEPSEVYLLPSREN